MSRLPIRVVKVGGSLFDLPDLAERIHGWLAMQPTAHHVLIAGGGSLVEQVRRWNKLTPISDETAHWMCVDLMTITAQLLHERLADTPLVEDYKLLHQRLAEPGSTLFGPANWMQYCEPDLPGQTLPSNWDVSSDSIAARLAIVLRADELVLLKSALPPVGCDVPQLSTDGYVDAMFARSAKDLPALSFVDLRTLSNR